MKEVVHCHTLNHSYTWERNSEAMTEIDSLKTTKPFMITVFDRAKV